jgi:hypothetical protein
MNDWNQNFSKLDIEYLRSPALAHPDAFDENALLAFAVATGRDKDELLASGCSEASTLRGLGEAYNGLWNMPSTKLFHDFCKATVKHLPHDFVEDTVIDLLPSDNRSKHPKVWNVIHLNDKCNLGLSH